MRWAGSAEEIESTCEEQAPEGTGEEQALEGTGKEQVLEGCYPIRDGRAVCQRKNLWQGGQRLPGDEW